MGQAGRGPRKGDPTDARNPGVKPYGKYGGTDTDVEREGRERKAENRGVSRANLRASVDTTRYPSGRTEFDMRVPLQRSESGRGVGKDYEGPASPRVTKRPKGRSFGRR